MKLVKKILLVLMIGFILIQFIQPTRNKSNEASSSELTKVFQVPENVQNILRSACYDCHSNNTKYPVYSRIQPLGWLLANHISNGKEELNFSEFGFYSLRRQVSKMSAIANSIKDGSMPLRSYAMVHEKARLNGNEKTVLIEWASGMKDSLRFNKKKDENEKDISHNIFD